MSNPVFREKNLKKLKNVVNFLSAELAQRVVIVKKGYDQTDRCTG